MAILGGSTRAASLEVDVKADVDQAERTLSNFGSKLGTGIKAGAMVAGAALAGIGVAAVAGIGKAIGSASDLAETVSKSNTVFGASSAAINKWSQTSSTAFGQSRQKALEAASSFGNMFVQLGIGTDQAAKMSMSMTELASDFASFHNADISEVINAQTAAFRGEYDAVQRFVPTINAAAVEQKALEMGLGATTKELDAQDKALATQALMMEGAGDAMGDFARTSGGLANQQRILAAVWEDVTAKIGAVFLPIATKVVKWLASTAMPMFQEFADGLTAFGNSWGKAADGVTSSGFAGAMERLSFKVHEFWTALSTGMTENEGGSWWENLALSIRSVIRAVIDAAKWVNGAVQAFGGWGAVATTVATALGMAGLAGAVLKVIGAVKNAIVMVKILHFLFLTNPVTVWVMGLAALAFALVTLYQRSEAFRDIVQGVWNTISAVVLPIVQQFLDTVLALGRDLLADAMEVWPSIQETITHVFNLVRDVITVVLAVIETLWGRFGDNIMSVVRIWTEYIANTIRNVMEVIKGIIQVVTGIINGDWAMVWEGIKSIFDGVWSQIVNIGQTAMRYLLEAIQVPLDVIDALWDNTFGRMVTGVANAMGSIKSGVSDGVNSVKNFIGQIPGAITGVIGAVKNAAVNLGRSVMDGIENGFKAAAGFAADVASSLRGAVAGVINKILRTIEGPVNTALDLLDKAAGPLVNFPDVKFPRLAMGGVFDRPVFAQIAEAGKEAVLPLTRPGRMRQILSDPAVAAAVAAALPWAKAGWSALTGAGNVQVHNTGGQVSEEGKALIENLIVQGSNLTADDVMQAAAWHAHTRQPVRGTRG